MCLAIPGKVEEILTEGDLLIGRVNFGGVVKRVCLDYVPDLKVGDYTLSTLGLRSRRSTRRRRGRRWTTFARWACWTPNWRTKMRPLRGPPRRRSRLVQMETARCFFGSRSPNPASPNPLRPNPEILELTGAHQANEVPHRVPQRRDCAADGAEIQLIATRPWKIMEVCGGQTHSIIRNGIDQMLPAGIEMIHGPGCPVCVTPLELIDKALAIAAQPGVIFCSYGDMLRVPGTEGDLFQVKSAGGDVRVVYSPLDAVELAVKNPRSRWSSSRWALRPRPRPMP